MKNILVAFCYTFVLLYTAAALNSTSSLESKLVVREYREPLRKFYLAKLRDQDFLISILEKGKPICTGYIVSQYSFLTTAHCMKKYEEDDYSGLVARDINGENEILTSRSHPYYGTKFNKFHDISVVTVKGKFSSSGAQLPPQDFMITPEPCAALMGWTSPEHKKEHALAVDILSENKCLAFLRENDIKVPRQLENNLLCAKPSMNTYSVEPKDVGCPVLQGENYIIGIFSGEYYGHFEDVYIMTNIWKHLSFIKKEIKYSEHLLKFFEEGERLPKRMKTTDRPFTFERGIYFERRI